MLVFATDGGTDSAGSADAVNTSFSRQSGPESWLDIGPCFFLQMSLDDPDYFSPESDDFAVRQLHDINGIVANCTTPSNLFHIFRRQTALQFRKPLVIMSPRACCIILRLGARWMTWSKEPNSR
ncbi:unnamed protein product [Diabrotica balteata]|uniref:Uncharacterized protein n=1 Tax=Diabrotica balteata TaxID=107213 RepID=A0A9N9SR06_DIABA|nr:unnamed protein product [Diabrotica balteata]